MQAAQQAPETTLTQREKEILSMIANGCASKQIADQLNISVNTVSNHRKNMLFKTGARSSAELVQIYLAIISK